VGSVRLPIVEGYVFYPSTGLQSNTLHPVSSCRVLVLGLFVVGVTNWSGEGVVPKSLRTSVWFIG
jgi:hypothetical protein